MMFTFQVAEAMRQVPTPLMRLFDSNRIQWYINQNQFYRQIRNFVFDLTGMLPSEIYQDDQE
jgi:hypothetical protein